MLRNFVLVTLCAFALAACSGGNKAEKSDTQTTEESLESGAEPAATSETAPMEGHEGHDMHGAMAMCPMHVEGTTMAIEETEGGMALVFTNAANVEEVQKRTAMFAAHHVEAMANHTDASLPSATASAENTETGARLLLAPVDPSGLEAFRAEFARRHDAQGEAKCPMAILYGGEPMAGAETAPN